MYAVIEDSGHQIRVAQGDVIDVDLREIAEGATQIEFDRILLVGGEETKIGTPLVEGAKVVGEIVNPLQKGPKVHSYYWRRRKASRKKIGHRQKYIRVKITEIKA